MRRYQYLPPLSPENADIVFLPVPYGESVTGRPGTADAPNAILKASEQIEYYDEILGWSPMRHLEYAFYSPTGREAIPTLLQRNPSREGALLITLGGDHSVTPFVVRERMKEPGTVLFLDAHADLRPGYRGDPHSHASAARHLLDAGHRLVMVGIRSMFEKEAELIARSDRIECYDAFALQEGEVCDRLLTHLARLEGPLYLSIDMDVFDPAFVPGVGTPQPGGIDWYFSLAMLQRLLIDARIELRGVDLVELIPDEMEISQTFAAKLIQKIISFWAKGRGYDRREPRGAQTRIPYQ